MSRGGSHGTRPVKSYVDPRIEIYEPTVTSPYFRIVAYDDRGRRVVNTTGGRTLKAATSKAAAVAKQLRRRRRTRSADPSEVLVHEEAEEWLVPTNHRTRENKPWSNRHAENMVREWELRISPHIPRRTTVDELNDRQLWVRILNEAQASGLAPSSVQKTGQACSSFVTWLMDRELLHRNPMQRLRYSVTKADNDGYDPLAVRPDEIPNLDMVCELGWWMVFNAWVHRPGRGGNRRADVVGPEGRGLQPMLAAMTGLRNGELFALRPSRIDVDNLEIEVVEQLVQEDSYRRYMTPPKHGSIRTVTFAAFLQDDLRQLIEHRREASREDDPILFCAPEGGWEWRSNHTQRFRRAADAAGWPRHITWYGLRHLYGVTQLERLPLEVVSKLMGHTDPKTTAQRYLSVRVGWLDQARAAARDIEPF